MLRLAVIDRADYSRPDWAWAVIGVMTAWTIVTTVAYAHPYRRTRLLLSTDLAVTAVLLLSTAVLQSPQAMRHGVTPLTATWLAGPVLAWAVRYGRRAGTVAALIMSGCDLALFRGAALSVVLNGVVLLTPARPRCSRPCRPGGGQPSPRRRTTGSAADCGPGSAACCALRSRSGGPGAAAPTWPPPPGCSRPGASSRARRDHLPGGNPVPGRAARGIPSRSGPPGGYGRRAAHARRAQRDGHAAAPRRQRPASAARRGDRALRCSGKPRGTGRDRWRCRERRDHAGPRAGGGAGDRLDIGWLPESTPRATTSGPRAQGDGQPIR